MEGFARILILIFHYFKGNPGKTGYLLIVWIGKVVWENEGRGWRVYCKNEAGGRDTTDAEGAKKLPARKELAYEIDYGRVFKVGEANDNPKGFTNWVAVDGVDEIVGRTKTEAGGVNF